MAETIISLAPWLFMAAVFGSVLIIVFQNAEIRQMQRRLLASGVELEAEILARFEAGALQGSELARVRQPLMASWDPYELELRYDFGGREIISRGRVSAEAFFLTRSRKTLKIKVSPSEPEKWAALVYRRGRDAPLQ